MNDKSIMKDGKPHKIAQVVMLPTEKASNLFLGTKTNKIYIEPIGDIGIPQHLYILSSEEIKEGDWTEFEGEIKQADKAMLKYLNSSGDEAFKKIIATTDESLIIITSIGNQGTSMFTKLPRPSDDFIKAFVKAQGKGFDKVLVEYKDYWVQVAHSMDVDYKLKVSPDNTITIRAIQEEKIDIIDLAEIELKSYVNPSEEFKDAFIAGVTIGYYHKNKEAIHTWIDKGIDVFSGEKTSWSREEVIEYAQFCLSCYKDSPDIEKSFKLIEENL